jgi:hypothetical protein
LLTHLDVIRYRKILVSPVLSKGYSESSMSIEQTDRMRHQVSIMVANISCWTSPMTVMQQLPLRLTPMRAQLPIRHWRQTFAHVTTFDATSHTANARPNVTEWEIGR